MKKFLKVIGYIFILVILIFITLFSPTIISFFTDIAKNVNTNIIVKMSDGEWLSFYAAILGSVITLIAFLSTAIESKKQSEVQHKENINMLKHQDEMSSINEAKNKITDFIKSYVKNDKLRIAHNLVIDKKYLEAYEIIEEVRNEVALAKCDLYIHTDLENDAIMVKCQKCKILRCCEECNKVKKEINKIINDMDNIYVPFLDAFQENINILKNKQHNDNYIYFLEEEKFNLKRQNELYKEKNNISVADGIQMFLNDERNKKIDEEIEEVKNKITKEEIDNVTNKYSNSMERFNKEMPLQNKKLMDKMKEYIKLKEEISLEKLKM